MTYITKSTVLDRGWTQGAIEKWLGEPDKYAPNPHGRSKPPMNLFDKARVQKAEQRDDWMKWLAKSQISRAKISKAANQNQEEKRKVVYDFVMSIEIPVAEMSIPRLERKAAAHFDQLKWERDWHFDSDTTLEKKCVNYLRHRCSSYESVLDNLQRQLFGKTKCTGIYEIIKTKVLNAIAEKYEFLSDECDRQIADIGRVYP